MATEIERIKLSPDTFAYPIDVKPAAQWRLSSSITEPTGSAVDKIKQLEAYYFYMNQLGQDFGWDRPEDNGGTIPKRIGLIAQELMAVEPSLVRVMDWLDEPEDYYWVDYEALYVLCLDAINELNARADALKTQLGMTIDETYPTRAASTTLEPASVYSSLTVTPTTGPEGSQSVWTVTGSGIPDGTVIGFKISGQCNLNDITCPDEANAFTAISEEDMVLPENEGFDPTVDGWAFGIMTFTNNQAQVTLDYVLDGTAEGPETIIMTLKDVDSHLRPVPELTATATITDA